MTATDVLGVGEFLLGLLGITITVVGLAYVFRGAVMRAALTETREQNDELRETVKFERQQCDLKIEAIRTESNEKIDALTRTVERLTGRLDAQDDHHADIMADKLGQRFEIKLKAAQ